MVLDKKGVWRGYILTGILGLLVVTISLYFIFNEYFTSDDIDWEQCRQSLSLRNGMPEKDLRFLVLSAKGTLPVRCGTKTVTIDYKDVDRAEREIAETISSCWYMLGEGSYRIFPGTVWNKGELDIPCMVCARIHIDKDMREFYSNHIVDIERALDGSLQGDDETFLEYLSSTNGENAFVYFSDWDDEFSINIHKRSRSTVPDFSEDIKVFNFSKYMYSEKGDLFITYAYPTTKSIKGEDAMSPYIILTQYDDINKLNETWMSYDRYTTSAKVCSSIESIPS